MSKPKSGPTSGQKSKTDDSVRQAIERATHHAGLALAEGVASTRALLDAASIGVTGESAQTRPHLAEFAKALDQISDALSGQASSISSSALTALLEALETEISRWEVRSKTDDDARAVLRAFLGLREFFWELGVRPKAGEGDRPLAKRDPQRPRESEAAKAAKANSSGGTTRGTPRVQRIVIEG